MTELLLGIVAGLIATQTLVVKWLMSRSDKAVEAREKAINVLIESLTTAVEAFAAFEEAEDKIHEAILAHLERLTTEQVAFVATQERILVLLQARSAEANNSS